MPANNATPTVSRVCSDGTLVELLYDPADARTTLAVAEPGRAPEVGDTYTLSTGERLVPYSPENNLIARGFVLLPSSVGEFGDKGDLLEALRAFVRRYAELSPAFEDIAVHYVLLSWVYDAFNELPYLRFRGDFGTGKTRALITVGSLCYKPFFASGASTVSPLFHVLDAFGCTLLLDEADFRFSDATAELTKILNNGNMAGLPVLRTMTNRHRELSPQAFSVFGPKIIAMRERFSDDALESRFLTEETCARELRPDTPIHLPGSLKDEARQLRNRLLAWRFAARHVVGPDPSRLVAGASPRTNQTALALLSLVDDVHVRERIAAELVGAEARGLEERASCQLPTMLAAVDVARRAASGHTVSINAIARCYNERAAERLQVSVSNKWVGWYVRSTLRLPTYKSGGVYVVPKTELAKLPRSPGAEAPIKHGATGEPAA